MSLLTGALGRLLKTAESALAGWITLLIADHAPFVHLSQDQVLGGIVFLLGAAGHYIHTHGLGTKIFGRVKKFEGLAQRGIGTAGLSEVEKELARMVGMLEARIAGVHLAAASSAGNATPPPAATKTSATSAKAAAATK